MSQSESSVETVTAPANGASAESANGARQGASANGKPAAGGSPLPGMRGRLALLIGRRRRKVAGLIVVTLGTGFAEAASLALLAEIAASLARGNSHKSASALDLFQIHMPVETMLAIALALSVVRLALQVPLSLFSAQIVSEVQATLRLSLFAAFTRASWAVQSRDREGQLQETMTSQVMQATGGALQTTGLISSALMFIVLLGSAVALNPVAAGAVLVITTLMFAVLRPMRRLGVRLTRLLSAAQVKYARAVAEAIRVAEETQVFGVGGAQRKRVAGFVTTSQVFFFRAQLLAKLIQNVYVGLIYLLLVLVLWGIYLLGANHVASLGAVLLILVRAGQQGQSVSASYQGLCQSLPFIERVQETIKRYEDSSPPAGDTPLGEVQTLAFEHVSYAYRAGRPVLSDISFEMTGCQAVGIIGPSGAGKSTLIQLLLQLRRPDEGRYLVNGIDAQRLARSDWYRLVSYVPQEPRLLHTSVADNIRYFRDIDDAAVERAARLARIHEDVMSWPKGYETVVGPRADAVSGGQQQRICLARALVAEPSVLVLDEPTSALDPHSETLIQESLDALKDRLTLFIIAHRMSTLDICDRVMVILDGRLVAFDSRTLLQKENQYYRSASMIAAGASGRELL